MEKNLMHNLQLHNVRLDNGSVCDVAFEQGRIIEIPEKQEDVEIFDCHGKLAMPGFVESHVHLDKCYLADGAIMGDLGEWNGLKRMVDIKRKVTRKDIVARARRAIERAIMNGTTAIRTQVDVDPIVGLKGMEALLELRESLKSVITLQVVAFPQEGIVRSPGTTDLLSEALAMGADVIGGGPMNDTNREKHLDIVFDLAKKFDVDIDLHVDSDPTLSVKNYPECWDLPAIISRTKAHGMAGKVALSHFCSLSNLTSMEAAPLIEDISRHDFHIVVCPTSELYAGGREASAQVPRNITRVKDLYKAGVNVSVSFDNMRDPLVPFGNAHPLDEALLLAKLCHLGTVEGLRFLWDTVTVNGATLMHLPQKAGISSGAPADIILLNATDPIHAMLDCCPPYLVIRAGIPVARTEISQKLLSQPQFQG